MALGNARIHTLKQLPGKVGRPGKNVVAKTHLQSSLKKRFSFPLLDGFDKPLEFCKHCASGNGRGKRGDEELDGCKYSHVLHFANNIRPEYADAFPSRRIGFQR